MTPRRLLIAAIAILFASNLMEAQGPPSPPLSQKELVTILKSKQQAPQAVVIIEQRGVDFELTPQIEKQLRKAKATDAVIEAVSMASPKARAERAAAAGVAIATPEEEREFKAVQDELDPNVTIQLASEYAQKYPNSPLLTYVYAFSAAKYEQKNDVDNVIDQCEKSLALKSDNLMCLLIITHALPQPQSLRTGNVEQKLEKTEQYTATAIEAVNQLIPQPSELPEQFEGRKGTYLRDLHSALGMVHLQRAMQSLGEPDPAELAKAETEYETAVGASGNPQSSDYYRLGEVREHMKKLDAAIEAYNHCIELDLGMGIRAYAEQRIEAIKKAKSQ